MAVNKTNRKNYVGQAKNFSRRKNKHKNDALSGRSNCAFHKAIRKYGWNNFEWYEITSCITNQNDLNELEKLFIQYFNSKQNGYNETLGGEGSSGFAHGQKSIEKIRKNTIQQIKTKGHPSFGIAKSHKSKIKNMNSQPNRKEIICNETKEIFSSTKECSRKMNIDYRTLCRHLKKQKYYNSIKGFTYNYI